MSKEKNSHSRSLTKRLLINRLKGAIPSSCTQQSAPERILKKWMPCQFSCFLEAPDVYSSLLCMFCFYITMYKFFTLVCSPCLVLMRPSLPCSWGTFVRWARLGRELACTYDPPIVDFGVFRCSGRRTGTRTSSQHIKISRKQKRRKKGKQDSDLFHRTCYFQTGFIPLVYSP